MSQPHGRSTLSKRAIENIDGVDYWKPLVAALADPWSTSNPHGMAILGVAENTLMHDELQNHIKQNFEIDPIEHFSYGHGPQGSVRLRTALASFFNRRFLPVHEVLPQEFLMTTGVTALVDHITWATCDPGEAILYPQPLYAGFTNDLPIRARGKLVPVPFATAGENYDLNDVFDADANTRCFERAYCKCQAEGIKVKGVMITNPHNPLGKCYPPETIKAIAAFCAKYNLHYLSDEIYAMSTFDNADYPDATKFTSVLAVELSDVIDSRMVHVLYGMSKDFCGNGLRLGALHSRNPAMIAAVTGIAAFSWQAYMVQDIWARMLEDRAFLDEFFAKSRKRLADRYTLVTNFLREHGISYFEGGNAGVFIWVDLRDWLREDSDAHNSQAFLLSSPGVDKYKGAEELLGSTWWNKAVMVSKGTGCLTEELGWFRIVFTVDEACLRTGLQRFVDGVREAATVKQHTVVNQTASYEQGTLLESLNDLGQETSVHSLALVSKL